MDKMQKVKVKYIGSQNKLSHFQYNAKIISIEREKALWVDRGVGSLSLITKKSLKFAVKA